MSRCYCVMLTQRLCYSIYQRCMLESYMCLDWFKSLHCKWYYWIWCACICVVGAESMLCRNQIIRVTAQRCFVPRRVIWSTQCCHHGSTPFVFHSFLHYRLGGDLHHVFSLWLDDYIASRGVSHTILYLVQHAQNSWKQTHSLDFH